MKWVIVTGGVVSGLGKGITASSIGVLLQACGVVVTSIKIDPYLNIDAGVLSPFEHGEVYVLEDGGEVDLDLGNYERFLNLNLTRDHNITTGKVYQRVIEQERKGSYLGKTVQVIPHITDEIQAWMNRVAVRPVDGTGRTPEVCIVELGGTVGDIESMVFLEALRQLRFSVGADNLCHVHVSLVPVVGGEPKSKPTQHSVKELRTVGLTPDIIVCRSPQSIPRSVLSKISLFCMVPVTHVLPVPDLRHLYEVPIHLFEMSTPHLIMASLRINKSVPDGLPAWERMLKRVLAPSRVLDCAIVGKYTTFSDSYLSLQKAILHASVACHAKVNITWIESSHLSELAELEDPDDFKQAWVKLRQANMILVPGGFGNRGTLGKMAACRYARENNVPFLGICLGFQMAVCEYARNVMGLEDANSEEFDEETPNRLIMFMPEVSKTHMGGTMRLGARETDIEDKKSMAFKIYKKIQIVERHRHRYEVNPDFVDRIEEAGLKFTGRSDVRMEIFELPTHPFFIGVQYHPEYLSRPLRPSPPFVAFVRAAIKEQTESVQTTSESSTKEAEQTSSV